MLKNWAPKKHKSTNIQRKHRKPRALRKSLLVKAYLQDKLLGVFGLRASGFGIRASGFGLRASRFALGLRASGFGLRASGFGLRASGFGLRGFGLSKGSPMPSGRPNRTPNTIEDGFLGW